jgi:hypothetical protein
MALISVDTEAEPETRSGILRCASKDKRFGSYRGATGLPVLRCLAKHRQSSGEVLFPNFAPWDQPCAKSAKVSRAAVPPILTFLSAHLSLIFPFRGAIEDHKERGNVTSALSIGRTLADSSAWTRLERHHRQIGITAQLGARPAAPSPPAPGLCIRGDQKGEVD